MASYVKVGDMFNFIFESLHLIELWMESYDVVQALCGTTVLGIA